jgi:manganese/iron transport system permease protein
MIDPVLRNASVVAVAMAVACAVLSVFVVARHWAFVGEGISHSGFGGAGTAWMLALVFPAFDQVWVPYVAVVVFCVGTAIAIGALSSGQRVATDTAVGIFLVASLAWGFVGQQLYSNQTGKSPVGFENILFGRQLIVPDLYAVTAVCIGLAVLVVVAAMGKEIVAYCFDPLLARTSGVKAGLVHYVMIVTIAITIAVCIPMVGSVLTTALLLLPGATALLVARRLSTTVALSIATALLAAIGGVLAHQRWHVVPIGPAIVLGLFAQFVIGYAYVRLARRAA